MIALKGQIKRFFPINSARSLAYRISAVAVVAVGVVPLAASPVYGWGAATHLRIAREAVGALPSGMSLDLTDASEGVLYPDFNLRDLENHRSCPDGSCGAAHEKISSDYTEILSDFQPRTALRMLSWLLLVLPAGCSQGNGSPAGPSPEQDSNLSFRLGSVGHYIADINAPYHTIPQEDDIGLEHKKFEQRVDDMIDTIPFRFDGRHTDVGGDVRGFVLKSAGDSFADLQFLTSPAAESDDALFRQVVERRFSRAVNDTVDLWYSILIRIQ